MRGFAKQLSWKIEKEIDYEGRIKRLKELIDSNPNLKFKLMKYNMSNCKCPFSRNPEDGDLAAPGTCDKYCYTFLKGYVRIETNEKEIYDCIGNAWSSDIQNMIDEALSTK